MYVGFAVVAAVFAFLFYRMCTAESDGYLFACCGMVPILMVLVFQSVSAYKEGTLTGPLVGIYEFISVAWTNTIVNSTKSGVDAIKSFITSDVVTGAVEYACIGIVLAAVVVCVLGVRKGLKDK